MQLFVASFEQVFGRSIELVYRTQVDFTTMMSMASLPTNKLSPSGPVHVPDMIYSLVNVSWDSCSIHNAILSSSEKE